MTQLLIGFGLLFGAGLYFHFNPLGQKWIIAFVMISIGLLYPLTTYVYSDTRQHADVMIKSEQIVDQQVTVWTMTGKRQVDIPDNQDGYRQKTPGGFTLVSESDHNLGYTLGGDPDEKQFERVSSDNPFGYGYCVFGYFDCIDDWPPNPPLMVLVEIDLTMPDMPRMRAYAYPQFDVYAVVEPQMVTYVPGNKQIIAFYLEPPDCIRGFDGQGGYWEIPDSQVTQIEDVNRIHRDTSIRWKIDFVDDWYLQWRKDPTERTGECQA